MSEIANRKQKNRTELDGMGQCQRLVGQVCFEKSHYEWQMKINIIITNGDWLNKECLECGHALWEREREREREGGRKKEREKEGENHSCWLID